MKSCSNYTALAKLRVNSRNIAVKSYRDLLGSTAKLQLNKRTSHNCNLIMLGRLPQACTTKVQYHIRAELRIFTVQLNETIAKLKVQVA